MELNELKNTWRQLDGRIARLEAESLARAHRVVSDNVAGSQRRLATNYRTKAIAALAMPFLGLLLLDALGLPLWIAVLYGVFGLAMAAVNFYFARLILKADFLGIPVVEAIAGADRIQRMRRRIMVLSLILGGALLALLLYTFYLTGLMEIFWGGVGGAVIGAVIGFINLRRQNRLLRSIRTSLRDLPASPAEA